MSLNRDARLLERAARQELTYDHRAGRPYQQTLLREAAEALGADVVSAQPWRRNRNADLYRLRADDGDWLLKVLVSKPASTLQCEFEHLVELDEISRRDTGFIVPEPKHDFTQRSAYVMGFVECAPLVPWCLTAALPDATAAVQDFGAMLATIHGAWATGEVALETAPIARDLAFLPWEPNAGTVGLIEHCLGQLEGWPIATSRLYLDYDPANMGVGGSAGRVLFDPPDARVQGAVFWDLGSPLLGLRRLALKRPWAARRAATRLAPLREAFLVGYAAPWISTRQGKMALLLAELVRLGQLWHWWMSPMRFRRRSIGFARAAYALPWLRRERRQLLEQLSRVAGEKRH